MILKVSYHWYDVIVCEACGMCQEPPDAAVSRTPQPGCQEVQLQEDEQVPRRHAAGTVNLRTAF